MKDELIYCSDLEALKIQLDADGYYDEKSDSYTVNHTLTPLKHNGNTSLSYVRNCVLPLGEVTDMDGNITTPYSMLESLGSYEQMEANPEARAKYLSVYDYEQVQTYTDEDGVVQEYYLPKKIGVFG